MAAAFFLLLRHANGRLGAPDLYRDTPGPLDATDMEDAKTLADVATAYLLNAWARQDAVAPAIESLLHSSGDGPTRLPRVYAG